MCHLLIVPVRIIHASRDRLSVARLHDHIFADLAHYGSILSLLKEPGSRRARDCGIKLGLKDYNDSSDSPGMQNPQNPPLKN